ncbi:MAG: hypothetical protein KDI13_04315 [Alphaproteobacteria bacterium]|nr:hypothetical protein [Alphaproteobacteria bacterium]
MSLKDTYTYVVAAADMDNLANPFGRLLDAMDKAGGDVGAKCVARSRHLPSRELNISSVLPESVREIQGIFYATFDGQLTLEQEKILAWSTKIIDSKVEYDRMVRASFEYLYELEPEGYD